MSGLLSVALHLAQNKGVNIKEEHRRTSTYQNWAGLANSTLTAVNLKALCATTQSEVYNAIHQQFWDHADSFKVSQLDAVQAQLPGANGWAACTKAADVQLLCFC